MKRYKKAIFRGEDSDFEYEMLRRGGRYTGTFLVFEDGPNYLGSVLFSVYGGKVSGKSMKGYWEFRKEWRVPNDWPSRVY